MNRRAPRSRRGFASARTRALRRFGFVRGRVGALALLAGAALLLALGAYIAVGNENEKRGESESTVSARAVQRFFARTLVRRERTVAGAELVGRVLSTAGVPIRGARVCAACASCLLTHSDAARCKASDDKGVFSLEVESTFAYVLSAQAAGFVTGYARQGAPFYVAADAREQFELHLSEGRENVAGTVIDALGGPVARARVKLVRFVDALTPTLEVLADDEGRFSASVPNGSVTLRAEADGYAPTTAAHVAPSQNIILALTPESIVRGTVVEMGTGKRVAGVSIFAHPRGGSPRHPQTTSNEAGEFEVRGLDPGRYLFTAEGDHYRGGTRRLVEVGLAERLVDLQIEVEPAALVLGRVEISGSGAPCPQGRAILGSEGPLTIPVAQAAEPAAQDQVPDVACPIQHDGSVRFQGVPAGRYHVMIQCLHHVYESGPALVDVHEGAGPLLWKVRPGGGLHVHVVSSAGRPVGSAKLSLEFPLQSGRRGLMPMVADQNGQLITPRNMPPGTYRLHADAMYGLSPLSVDIPRKGGVTELTLTLPGSAEVLVSVENEAGEPADDLRVIATRAGASHATAHASAQAGVVATPRPAASAIGAAPPPSSSGGAGLLAAPTTMPFKAAAVAQGDGHYRLGPLSPATYRVEVQDGDNPPLIVAEALALQPSQQAELRAVVNRGGTIRGKVVDEQAHPVANAWIKAEYQGRASEVRLDNLGRESRGVGLSRVLSDEDGNFQLDRLAKSAIYDLRAEKHHGGHTVQPGVREGSSVSLKLPSPGTLRGTVVDENGRPATSFDVAAGLVNVPESVQTLHVVSRDGRFQLEGVPAGRVQLQITARDGREAERLVDLSPNQRLEGLRLSFGQIEVAPAHAEIEARGFAREQDVSPTKTAPSVEARGSAREQIIEAREQDDARESGREQRKDALKNAPKPLEASEQNLEGA
jgi:hypothetical protein